ncbi:hypothetical protein, partial [Acinetobacter guillouiae]|uniref:hypothetical protein n=1 Tax=Acinetobacter guillouiae TaxID=106649 RepID=UPI00148EEEBE
SANQGDNNIVSNGTLNGKNIYINSKQGTLSIQSKLDLNVVPKKEITYDKRAPDIAVETYTKNVLTGLNGVNLVSSDLGKISLGNTNINAENGNIQIYGGNGIDLKEQFSSALVEVEFWGRKVLWPFPTKDYSKISSKGLYLKSNKDLNMNYISINTIGGGINVEALGETTIVNSNLKSDKNIQIVSKDILSTGLDINSGQNIALQSKDLTVTERSKYNANGMVSLVSEGGNGLIDSEVLSKGFYLKSNTGSSLKNTSVNTIGGKINIEAVEDIYFENSTLKSDKNIEFFSDGIYSNRLNVNSDQHIAVNSKGLISSKNSNFNA